MSDELLDEFAEFLRKNGYKSTKPLVSAVRSMLREKKTPDGMPLMSSKSRSLYRRAWRLWKAFLTYRKVDYSVIIQKAKRGAVRESVLRRSVKKVLKNETEFNMAMLKAVEDGRIYVNGTEDDPIIVLR